MGRHIARIEPLTNAIASPLEHGRVGRESVRDRAVQREAALFGESMCIHTTILPVFLPVVAVPVSRIDLR